MSYYIYLQMYGATSFLRQKSFPSTNAAHSRVDVINADVRTQANKQKHKNWDSKQTTKKWRRKRCDIKGRAQVRWSRHLKLMYPSKSSFFFFFAVDVSHCNFCSAVVANFAWYVVQCTVRCTIEVIIELLKWDKISYWQQKLFIYAGVGVFIFSAVFPQNTHTMPESPYSEY